MEDGDEIDNEIEENEGGEEDMGPPRQRAPPQKKEKSCNQRIDELSTPSKRIFLALWNEHAYHLPKDKVKKLKLRLQQLYALSPEETAKYFAEIRAEAKAMEMRRKLKQKLRKYLLDKHHQKQKERAYKLFKRLLKCGISYAAQNPVPPVISVRLRYLSDIILEQLCDLRKVGIPNRGNTDKLGIFLICVADWMAIAVERLYYAAQVTINEITQPDLTFEETLGEAPPGFEEIGEPIACSTPRKLSLKDETLQVPQTYKEFEFGHQGGASTPRNQSLMEAPKTYKDFGPPAGASTPLKQPPKDETLFASTTYDDSGHSVNEEPPEPSNPYYSFVESKDRVVVPTVKQPNPQSKNPQYSFAHSKASPETTRVFDKSHLEIPPFGADARGLRNASFKRASKSRNKSHRSSLSVEGTAMR